MKQRRARPVFASSRRLSRKRLGSIEKAVLSPLAGTQEAVLSPPTGPLATGPLPGAKEAVLSPPTGPLAGRHLFRVISSATAFHNLIRDQKSPEGALPGTPPESLTSLSDPVKQVCEAASRTPCLPLSDLQQRFKLSDLPQRFQHAPVPSDFLRHSFPQSNSRPKIARKRSSAYAPRISNVAFGTRKISL